MCFATVAAVAGVAGAATSAVGTITGGVANQNASNYQAAVASNNEIIANQNAVRAEQSGYASSQTESLKGAAASGKVKVAQASNGVDVNTGSNVDVQASEREANQLNTETVFQNDLMKAYGYRVNAENFQSESQLDTMKASEAVPASILSATGGLLSSASSIGGKWGSSSGSIPNIPGFNPIAGISGQ
jgi:hypothetical protein